MRKFDQTKRACLLMATLSTLCSLASCGDSTPTISIEYDGDEKPVQFGIGDLKQSLEKCGMKIVDSDGEYRITINGKKTDIGKQGYSIEVQDKTVSLSYGDDVGGMYGAMQIAEDVEFGGGFAGISSKKGTPYLKDRGFRLIPLMDCRTPCYTANGDATRANFENTWDLSFWDGLFARMARMRYNLFDMATLCAFPSMVKVPGYEDCVLEDVWVYNGEYDSSYHGNATDMFRPEHIQEGNYTVYKKMSMDEKIAHWQSVIESAHSHGIRFQYDIMNIYTFSEEITSDYGITDDRANAVTKDYLHKATKELLRLYDIDVLNVTAGENMDYPIETKMETEQWIYDVYGKACIDALGGKKAKDEFVFTYSTTEQNWPLWKDFPFERHCSTRYADTHMYAVTAPIYSLATRESLPEGTYDTYNLRNEDAYHFTWGDPDFAREFCRNMKHPKSTGFVLGSAGYYMGKEYEFVNDSENGGYYYDRHWLNYTLFGRLSYDPTLDNGWVEKKFIAHYADVEASVALTALEAIKEGSKWLCEFQKLFYNGGTDSSWYPETCQSHPTLFGYLDIKRFINADNAYGGSNYLSFAQYAREVKEGKTSFSGKTPVEVAQTLSEIAAKNKAATEAYRALGKGNAELDGIVSDQEAVYYLTKFYESKILSAVYLRQYNDTGDAAFKQKALDETDKVIDSWGEYGKAFLARFKAEKFARVYLVDPAAYNEAVAKDKETIEKWRVRNYD